MSYREYSQLSERVYWKTLENGLTVAVLPRPGFTKKLAYFVTDYGAVHTQMLLDGQQQTAPAGVAHYLEHKLFDMPGRDVSGEFAAMGANVNAFTSYDMTAYYFSCTENFDACLRLLLEFVSTPYFTEETVSKEQGIIGQEIDMTADSPETAVFENLMRAMYKNHPIHTPILGTRQTISQITPQVLRDCHRGFYNPANMMLCVVADVQPEQVCAIAQKVLGSEKRPCAGKQTAWQEEMTGVQPLVTAAMEVAMPMFQLGFKAEPLERGEAAVRQELVADLAAEALFGESSELYLRLYEQGVIDSSFGGGFETVTGMAMLTASGDAHEPEVIRDTILRQAAVLAEQGIDQQEFDRIKRSAMGRRIRSIDSFDATCFRLCAYHFSGFDYFGFPALYAAIQKEELQDFIRRVVTPERCSLSVITPNTQEVM